MPTVSVTFTALPEHVRTARFLAAAVARRAGIGDELLYEVRLAVGEACARAVQLHRTSAADVPVELRMIDDDGAFVVEVVDKVAVETRGDAGSVGSHAAVPEQALPEHVVLEHTVPEHTERDDDTRPAIGVAFDVVPSALGLALISGLADDVSVRSGRDGSVLAMTWRIPAAVDAPVPQRDVQ